MGKSSLKIGLAILLTMLQAMKAKTFGEPRYTKGHIWGRKKHKKPIPELEQEINYDEWVRYHNERNWTTKFPVLEVTQKYFKNSSHNISRTQLINLAVDYMVYEMAAHHIKLSIPCLHDMKHLWRKAFKDYFFDYHHHQKTYNISELYGFHNGLEFIHIFHMRTRFHVVF